MTPAFVDPSVRQRWDAYFAEVDRLLRHTGVDAAELRADLARHVLDSMAAAPDGSERERLEVALSRLGRPLDYLRPVIADGLIDRGTRSYAPVPIARGLSHAVLAGSRRTAIGLAFGIGYLLLAIFAAAAVLKPIWGDHVGLFRDPDGAIRAGIVATTPGARELLGWWAIPIALTLAVLLYVALTKGLRAVRRPT